MQAEVNYHISVTAVEQATGTLLKRYEIQIADSSAF